MQGSVKWCIMRKQYATLLTFIFVSGIASESRESPREPSQPQIWPHCNAVSYTEKCQGVDVQFHLHTRRGSEAVNVTDDRNNITSSKYDHLRPSVIIIHGYSSDMFLDALVSIKKEYLKSGDYNVWAVNFPSLVKAPCYPAAVYNVHYIARCISLLVNGLRGISVDPLIHVIGFSLGAHVAGRVGYELRDKKVDRVTGAEAKAVWEKLRHSFRDALRRQKKMMRSGVSADFIKLWKYQKEMGFLHTFMANRKREGNLQDDSDTDDGQPFNVGKEEQDALGMIDHDEEMQDGIQPPSTDDDNTASEIPHGKMRENHNDIAVLMKQNMETRRQMSSRRLKEMRTPMDPLYLFFMAMFETTKLMPPASQHIVRNQVYQAVSNMEASLLGFTQAPVSLTQYYDNANPTSNSTEGT